MSRDMVTVTPDDTVTRIVDLMEAKGVKRVPVVRDGIVTGIVSRANLISALARVAGEMPQPVVDDLVIRKGILDEIGRRPWSPEASLDIAVRDGVVTLAGTVPSEHLRDAVRVVAENAPGAIRVWDHIRVVTGP